MKKIIISVLLGLILTGCSTTIVRGIYEEGKEKPIEYIKVNGMGKGKFPGGYEGEGKPVLQFPQIELDK